MVRNVILRFLRTHMSKSTENWPRKIDFTIFSKKGGVADFDPPEESIWGVKISNRPNKVRVSKNHENLVFEITRFIGVRSAEESFLILRKMFRCRVWVENRFF